MASKIGLLPVIFTTARLWATDFHLGATDLESGNVDLTNAGFEEKPWLFFHYPQSPGLKHSIRHADEAIELADVLYAEFVRTIVIAGASGIANFLSLHYSDIS